MERKNLLKLYELLGIAAVGAILILSVLISGCVEEKPTINETMTINETGEKTKTWVDALNRTVEVPLHPKRIITLDKADTEILFTMGLEDRMIGRGYYCNVPHDALKLTDCGSPWNPNFEVILNLSPDLVILQRCCESYYKKNYEDIDKRFEKYNLTLVVMPSYPNDIYEVIDYIKYEGKLIGEEEKAEKIVEEMNKKLNFVKDKVKNLKDNEKPKVAMVSPPTGEKLFVWKTSPIETAGGINVFKDLKVNYYGGYINPENLLDKNPDVIIATYSGYDKDILKGKTKDEIERDVIKNMEKIPGWNKLKAVKNNRVCVINSYEHVGSPRVAEGLINIAKCIHPELFGNESSKNLQKQTGKETKTWVDALNRTVEVPVHPKRIITFSKQDIEILFKMGLGDKVVGKAGGCNYPPEALKLPDCGYTTKPNFEVILNQSPDLVMFQAYISKGKTYDTYKDITGRFEKYNLTVVANPEYSYTIYEVIDYIEHLGKLFGEEEKAEKIVEEMKKKLNFVKDKVKNLKDDEKPTVAMVSPPSGETFFVHGIYYPIEEAGGINAFSGLKGYDRTGDMINPEALIDKNPDVIIIKDLNSDAEILKGKTKEEIEKEVIKKMEKIPGWNKLKAVKNHRICVVNYYDIYAGGSRVADGLVEVAKCIHPELFGNESSNR